MKRLVLLFLLAACSLTAAAQSERYNQFKEYRNDADTLQMKQMLDAWGDKDPEYYAAWVNYCAVMANETEDPTWSEMGINWAKMGREAYPDDELLLYKQADAFFDCERFQDALPILLDIEERGLGDGTSWYRLAIIYSAKNDREKARFYLNKMIELGDEYDRATGLEILASIDQGEHMLDSLALHPDHAAIKALSQTPAYQELTARFAACDTTLTREKIAFVYYGAAYHHDYNYVVAECEDIRAMASEGKTKEAKDALNAKLKEYPVSLFLLISLYNLAENEEELMPCVWKAQQILSVIDNSGKVGDPERPFQVICIDDEYIALEQIFRMQEFKSQAAVRGLADDPLDQMTFVNPYGLEETLLFWLTPPYWERLNRLFGESN